jgi:DNA repair exonuclease SbcCD ATPase subunit
MLLSYIVEMTKVSEKYFEIKNARHVDPGILDSAEGMRAKLQKMKMELIEAVESAKKREEERKASERQRQDQLEAEAKRLEAENKKLNEDQKRLDTDKQNFQQSHKLSKLSLLLAAIVGIIQLIFAWANYSKDDTGIDDKIKHALFDLKDIPEKIRAIEATENAQANRLDALATKDKLNKKKSSATHGAKPSKGNKGS